MKKLWTLKGSSNLLAIFTALAATAANAVTLEDGDIVVLDGQSLFQVNPETGSRTLISSGNLLLGPSGVAYSPAGTLMVFIEAGTESHVVEVDPGTGAQAIYSQMTGLDSHGIEVDRTGIVWLVSEFGILRMNPDTRDFAPFWFIGSDGGRGIVEATYQGSRTIIATNTNDSGGGTELIGIDAEALMPTLYVIGDFSDGRIDQNTNGRILAVGSDNKSIVEIDLDTSAVSTLFSDGLVAEGGISDLALTKAGTIVVAQGSRLIELDQVSGVQSVLSAGGAYALDVVHIPAGFDAAHPILPGSNDGLPSGGWRLVGCGALLQLSTYDGMDPSAVPCWIDPPVAIGYTYTAEADTPYFAGVQVPTPLANGDANFTVEFDGASYPLAAGERFDFTSMVAGGVRTFQITGISTAESISPDDPTAFVTAVYFVSRPAPLDAVTMVPILDGSVADGDGDGVPDTTDQCANTSPGAIVDADGCSAAQRDGDGDGVSDASDTCPDTVLGESVDVSGCSAAQLPPIIEPVILGTLGENSWYTSNVSLSWQITSTMPLTAKTGCQSRTISGNTTAAGATFMCTATNSNGTQSQSVTIKKDASLPKAKVTAKPGKNAAGWRKSAVTVTFAGSDAQSGIASCSPAVLLPTEGVDQSASGTCTNNAGLVSAVVTASNIDIDLTLPTVTVGVPADGASFARNSVVNVDYSCSDALSGIASCSGRIIDGATLDTSRKVTNKAFTVTGKDAAGNVTKTTVRYSVL